MDSGIDFWWNTQPIDWKIPNGNLSIIISETCCQNVWNQEFIMQFRLAGCRPKFWPREQYHDHPLVIPSWNFVTVIAIYFRCADDATGSLWLFLANCLSGRPVGRSVGVNIIARICRPSLSAHREMAWTCKICAARLG